MNPEAFIKLLVKKFFGPYLKRYSSFGGKLENLEKILPLCLRENFASKINEKKVLIITAGLYGGEVDAIYAKAFESLGYKVVLLANYTPFLERMFSFFGLWEIRYFDNYFLKYNLWSFKKEAEKIIENKSEIEMLQHKKGEVHVGAFAASTFLRATRMSSFILTQKNKHIFKKHLAASIQAEKVADDILKEISPDLVFMIDRGYTPVGQIFDLCLSRGIDVITRNSSHKSGYEILKRYKSPEMSILHPYGLSNKSWEIAKNMEWNEEKWKALYGEIAKTYKSGDWFSEVGTQFNKKIYSKEKIFKDLGLDFNKKTAVIFPHIFWDGTFFWGENIYRDYYEWFCEVLKIAYINKNLNWVIKIHPANLAKARRDNYKGESLEMRAITDTLNKIPEHIKIIPETSDINTFSLFPIIDFCLTVRGTPGLESAIFGVSTITAGTGRYDRLGFTYDFVNKEEYTKALKGLPNFPKMSNEMVELARRFAFGSLILRPLHLDVLDYGFLQDEKASIRFSTIFNTKEDFLQSKFNKSFGDFIISQDEDYINKELF